MTPDAVLTDAEEALDALGELTGRTAKEEIVSRIFSRFCVGKITANRKCNTGPWKT